MTIPRAVVFDVGNVLYDWQPAALYEALIPDAAERAAFLRDVLTKEWHFRHDAGEPFAETSAALARLHPQYADAIAAWGPRFGETLPGMLPGMERIIDDLAARGVPLYAITNFSAEFWPPFRAREAALFDRFAGILVSGEERLVKPDPAIYALALERFGLKPGEALFFDDREENVAGARDAGFLAYRFEDAAGARAALEAHALL